MNLLQRIAYYLGGFTIGIILLIFFLSGKRTSCDYGPNARTLKNIRSKNRIISTNSLRILEENKEDTSAFTTVLKDGKVLFSESNTSLDTCKLYVIEGYANDKYLKFDVKNCNDEAIISDLQIKIKE